MGFRDSLKRWFYGVDVEKATKIVMDEQAQRLFSGLSMSRAIPKRGTAQLIQAYSEIPALRVIVQRLAESVAAVEWTVSVAKNSQGKSVRSKKLERAAYFNRAQLKSRMKAAQQLVELDDDPILDFLDAGNILQNGFNVRQIMQSHIELKGDAFAWIQKNPMGMPTNLWPLAPQWVLDIASVDNPYYEVTIGGTISKIPQDEMLYIRDPDPCNPYGRGVGIGETLADELDTDEYAAAFLKAFFYNDATPSLIIGFDEGISEPEIKRLQEDWFNKHRGAHRAHQPHFVSPKPSVDKITASFKDMDMINLRKFIHAVARQTFGMPPEIIGVIENSNRATIEAANYIFARWLQVPRLERWRIALQNQVIPMFDERKVIDYESPVPEDKDYILKVAQAASHTRKRSEWRKLQGLEPQPYDDIYQQPMNIVDVPAPEPGAPKGKGGAGQDGKKSQGVVKQLTPGDVLQIVNACNAAMLRDQVDWWPQAVGKWGQTTLDQLAETGLAGAGVNTLIKKGAFDLQNPEMLAYLRNFAGDRIKDINATTQQEILRDLRVTMEAGGIEGASAVELTEAIAAVFDRAIDYRSLRIARTEVNRAANYAADQAYKQSGVVEKHVWSHSGKPAPPARKDHSNMTGQERLLNEPFDYPDGVQTFQPGNSGVPHHDIQCQCWAIPITFEKGMTNDDLIEISQRLELESEPWRERTQRSFDRGFRKQEKAVLEMFWKLWRG